VGGVPEWTGYEFGCGITQFEWSEGREGSVEKGGIEEYEGGGEVRICSGLEPVRNDIAAIK